MEGAFQGNHPFLNFDPYIVNHCSSHYKGCGCGLRIIGKGKCNGYSFLATYWNYEESSKDFFVHFSERYDLDESDIVPANGDSETLRLHAKFTPKGNIRIVSPQLGKMTFPQTQTLIPPNPDVRLVFRKADIDYCSELLKRGFNMKDYDHFQREIWTTDRSWTDSEGIIQIPSLVSLLLRRKSLYNAAFGLTNGHPHMITATSRLYPNKFGNAILKLDRHVHKPMEATKIVFPHLDKALGLMYHHLDTEKYFGKLKIPIDFADCANMSLGTSAGINDFRSRKINVNGKVIKIDACGKKFETLQADINTTIAWMMDPNAPDPGMWWKATEKNENFECLKYFTEEEWEERMDKLRLYIIPSSIFVMFERLVSKVRFSLEHGKVIQVGHAWPHGGMDRLAKCLKIDHLNDLMPQIVEADLRNMDQSTNERLINLFYSFGLVYDDPEGEDYAMRCRIIRLLIRQITVRLTHLFGPTWAFVLGGVPSGVLSTSHMDSWIVALYLFLFLAFQIAMAPPEHQDELEEAALKLFAAIVYGDDHAYNKTMKPLVSKYFAGTNFSIFMKTYFGVELRNLKDGIPFLSTACMGELTSMGMTFLKHQAVRNPCKDEGQCYYLPYRESREYFVRVAWGRENKLRTLFDVILSSIGHAFGTYASNYDAWTGLKFIYFHAMTTLGITGARSVAEAVGELSTDDIKDYRRKGISKDELLGGFPSWNTLVKKNCSDEVYHSKIGGDTFCAGDEVW